MSWITVVIAIGASVLGRKAYEDFVAGNIAAGSWLAFWCLAAVGLAVAMVYVEALRK